MNDFIKTFESIKSEQQWRAMPLEEFETNYVEPLFNLSEEDAIDLIQRLSNKTYDSFRKKLWTVQDVPEEQDGYNRTHNIMVVLKRALLFRLPVIEEQHERSSITQQLAHASLILNPMLLERALQNNGEEDEDCEEDDCEGC